MTSTDQPMSRRAAREAARLAATGEVAAVSEDTQPAGPTGVGAPAVPTFPAAADPVVQAVPLSEVGALNVPLATSGEPPATTGLVGLDGQPLSRRRLREQRETQSIQVVGTVQGAGAAPAEAPRGAEAAPSAAPDAEGQLAPAATPAPSPSALPTFPATGASAAAPPPATAPSAPAAPAPEVSPQPPFLSTQPVPPAGAPAQPAAVSPEPVPQAQAPVQPAAPQSQATAPARPTAPQPQAPATPPAWQVPEGHWTRQLAQQDDETGEPTASREVGGVPQSTSSVLVVDHPAVLDLGGPLDATGEVLLTGTIPLSPDFARTGTVGSVGGAEHDDRFDSERAQESQPVKASAVASQHALGSPIVANTARRGGRGMTALLITASVLAVLVTGLVVTAIVLGWFHP